MRPFFSPDLPSSLARSRAACSRLTSMNRGSDNRRNGSSVRRSEGPERRGGRWSEDEERSRGEEPRGEGSVERRETGRGDKGGEGKVDEYENYSLDARTGRTLVKMAHGIN